MAHSLETADTVISAAAATRLEIVALSDVGQERELNEDTVWAAPLAPGADNVWQIAGLLVVADGMGGHQAGEIASGLAGQTVRQIFTSPRPAFAPAALTGQGLLTGLSSAVEEVNRAVFAAGESGAASGGRPGTTLTLALLREDEWAIGHVGDSRAYLIRRSGAQQITDDDSLVAEAVRRGQMTPEEAQTSQFRNQITKAIGLNAEVAPSTYQGSWAAGDAILLCSDGLTEYVTAEEMSDAIASGESLERACQSLIDMANRRGGHDNISVAAARLVPSLNGNGAAPLNGENRKPATWPPVARPTIAPDPFVDENPNRKRETTPATSKLPWIIVAVFLALGSAALGLWVGKRAVKPAAVAVKKTVSAPKIGEQEVVVSPPKTEIATPEKPPLVPDELSIVFYEDQRGLIISAPKYKLLVTEINGKKPVRPFRGSRFRVGFEHPDKTKEALANNQSQIQCVSPTGQLIQKIGAKGSFIIKPAQPGEYTLQMSSVSQKVPTNLAKITLKKK